MAEELKGILGRERERLLSDGTLENWAEQKKEAENGIIDKKENNIFL